MNFYQHPTAVIDPGASIGAGSKVWHFAHVCSGAEIGKDCILGQNTFIADNVRLHAMSMTAHPARKTGGASGDQRIIRHIPCNGASGCNEGITADRNTADDRGIGSDCGAAAEKNGFIKGVAVDL